MGHLDVSTNVAANVALSQQVAQTKTKEPEWRAAPTYSDGSPLPGDFADLSQTATANNDHVARAELIRMAREEKDREALALLRDIKGKYNRKETNPFATPYRAALTELKERRLRELAHHTEDPEAKASVKNLESRWTRFKSILPGTQSYDSRVDEAYGKKAEAWRTFKKEQQRFVEQNYEQKDGKWVARPGSPADGSRRPAGLEPKRAVVKEGDNLVKILKQNGYSTEEANDPKTWQRVMRGNKDNPKAFSSRNPHLIYPDEEILIPPPRSARPDPASAPRSPEAASQARQEAETRRAEETGEAKPKQAPDPEVLARKEMEARAALGDARVKADLERIDKHNKMVDQWPPHVIDLPPQKDSYRKALTDIKHDRLKDAAKEGSPAAQKALDELNSLSDWGGWAKGKLGFDYGEDYTRRVGEFYSTIDPHAQALAAKDGDSSLLPGHRPFEGMRGIMDAVRRRDEARYRELQGLSPADDIPRPGTNGIPRYSDANKRMVDYMRSLPPEEKKRLLSVIKDQPGAVESATAILNSDKTTAQEKQMAADFLRSHQATWGRLREAKQQKILTEHELTQRILTASPQEQQALGWALDRAAHDIQGWVAQQQRAGYPVTQEQVERMFAGLVMINLQHLAAGGHVRPLFGNLATSWRSRDREEQHLHGEISAAEQYASTPDVSRPRHAPGRTKPNPIDEAIAQLKSA